MTTRHRSLILIVSLGCMTAAAAGCSNSAGGGNRQINPSAVVPMTQAQKEQEIAKLKAQNPHFHVPPGLLSRGGPGQQIPAYLQKRTPSAAPKTQ